MFRACTNTILPIFARRSSLLFNDVVDLPVRRNLSDKQKYKAKPPVVVKRNPVVDVWDGMTVKELAKSTSRPPNILLQAINAGMLTNMKANLDSRIEDKRLLVSLVNLLGFRPVFKSNQSAQSTLIEKDAYPRPPALPEICTPRPPVVAILGHVDHGKTTLLDALRASRMVDEEFGGITQHIAAFTVSLNSVAIQAGSDNPNALTDIGSSSITFLDTPGHAAFSAIRARGASVTDVVVLVVAADDGVMPQTIESIRFAREANTPLVVAINKVDKEGANVGHVIEELASHGVVVEALGGDVQCVEISALKRRNLHSLIEAICVQAELMQIQSDPTGPAEAVVLEANMEHGIGKVATCLVKRGSLKKTPDSGPLVAGEAICSPRILLDDRGQDVNSMGPGFVVIVAGWKELPNAGDIVLELPNMNRASEVVRARRASRMQRKAAQDHTGYSNLTASYQTQSDTLSSGSSSALRKNQHMKRHSVMETDQPDHPRLPLLIKADVHGSLEAIKTLLSTCPADQCAVEFSLSGVGPLTESEVETAAACGATLVLFNTFALASAEKLAEENNVIIHNFNIIYRLAEKVRDWIGDRLPPLIVEKVIGEAEVLALFVVKEPRGGGKPLRVPVAGCRCVRGTLLADSSAIRSTIDAELLPIMEALHYRVIRPNRHNSSHADSDVIDSLAPAFTGTVLVSQANCRSLRHERNVVESIRKGVECGLVLTAHEGADQSKLQHDSADQFVSNWEVGDLVQCYALVRKPRQVQWEFQVKSID